MPLVIPTVTEQTSRGEYRYDIYSRLLRDRIIFIEDVIDDVLSNLVIAQILWLDADDPEKDIYLYINSPGGSVTSGLAIYDTMQFVRSDIQTICIGQAASMAAVLLAAGTKGKRYSLPHARIMLHQPLGGVTGQATDIELQANEMLRMRDIINDILVRHTSQTLEKIKHDTDRDQFLSAENGKEYGIIDDIFERKKDKDMK